MIMSRRHFSLLSMCLLAAPAVAQTGPRWFDNGSGYAASGKDVVAYFALGDPADRAVSGKEAFQMRYKGKTFLFSGPDTLATFKSDPDKYAPRYGGHCAFAMASGAFAQGDPDAWTVYKGALYLNASKSVRRDWSKDIPANLAKADASWAGFYPGER